MLHGNYKKEVFLSIMKDNSENIVLFYPHVSELAKSYVMETLDSRWIGQGPKVDQFEKNFSDKKVRGKVHFQDFQNLKTWRFRNFQNLNIWRFSNSENIKISYFADFEIFKIAKI